MIMPSLRWGDGITTACMREGWHFVSDRRPSPLVYHPLQAKPFGPCLAPLTLLLLQYVCRTWLHPRCFLTSASSLGPSQRLFTFPGPSSTLRQPPSRNGSGLRYASLQSTGYHQHSYQISFQGFSDMVSRHVHLLRSCSTSKTATPKFDNLMESAAVECFSEYLDGPVMRRKGTFYDERRRLNIQCDGMICFMIPVHNLMMPSCRASKLLCTRARQHAPGTCSKCLVTEGVTKDKDELICFRGRIGFIWPQHGFVTDMTGMMMLLVLLCSRGRSSEPTPAVDGGRSYQCTALRSTLHRNHSTVKSKANFALLPHCHPVSQIHLEPQEACTGVVGAPGAPASMSQDCGHQAESRLDHLPSF